MIVQCKTTKRELDMFWIEVCAMKPKEVIEALKKYCSGIDEKYEYLSTEQYHPASDRFRIICTRKHHRKLINYLVKEELLYSYENVI